jgi:hypothetical protein
MQLASTTELFRSRRKPYHGAIVLAVTTTVICAALGVVISLQPPRGKIVVELGDNVAADDVKIEVQGNGESKVVDAKNGWTIGIREGTYNVQLAESNDRFNIDHDKITVSRDKKTHLTVTLQPAALAASESSSKPNSSLELSSPLGKRVSFFNGRDFAGLLFQPSSEFFSLDEGAIVGHPGGKNRRSYMHWALSTRDYSDFVLRLQFCVDANANGGIALRATPGERDRFNLLAPVLKLTGPDIRSFSTGDSSMLREGKNTRDHEAEMAGPPGSWNQLELIVKGNTMRALVNDKLVSELTAPSGVRLPSNRIPGLDRRSGRIGFQIITGTIRFRNIDIIELEPSE